MNSPTCAAACCGGCQARRPELSHTWMICRLGPRKELRIHCDVDLIRTGSCITTWQTALRAMVLGEFVGGQPMDCSNGPRRSAPFMQAHVDEGECASSLPAVA